MLSDQESVLAWCGMGSSFFCMVYHFCPWYDCQHLEEWNKTFPYTFLGLRQLTVQVHKPLGAQNG